MRNEAAMKLVVAALNRADTVTVLTGAGISAASGIPTFRGATGLWSRFRPEDLASADGFARDPKIVWQWYDERRCSLAKAQPSEAHRVLASWEGRFAGCRLITQNVDDLHEQAGSRSVTHLHGSIWQVRCWQACSQGNSDWEDRRCPLIPLPPHCPHCDSLLRPAVVWFGEMLSQRDLSRANAAMNCDVLMVVGTSSQVYPAAALVLQAKQKGAYTVEINQEATPLSEVFDAHLTEDLQLVFPELDRLLDRT